MTFAAGSRHDLTFIPEVTFGQTPASPAMKLLRYTGTTLNMGKAGIRSPEMYSDGQLRDLRHGNRRVQGNIDFALSYGAHDAWLEALLGGTWTANVLKRGTQVRSFSVERRFLDVGQYLRYVGVVPNTATINITPGNDGAIVTGTLGVIGRDMGAPATATLGEPTDVATFPPFDTLTGVLTEGGAELATVTGLTLNINNNMEPTYVVGSAVTPQIVPGARDVDGTLTAYFESATLLGKFISEAESSLTVGLDGPAGGDLSISLPRIKYTGGDIPISGSGPVTLTMPFTGLRDATAGSNIVITRTPAA